MRSADSTSVREEANGVLVALKEKEAEESWWGFKIVEGQEWSFQEDKQMYQGTGMTTQRTHDSVPMYREQDQGQATKEELEITPRLVRLVSGKPKFTCS